MRRACRWCLLGAVAVVTGLVTGYSGSLVLCSALMHGTSETLVPAVALAVSALGFAALVVMLLVNAVGMMERREEDDAEEELSAVADVRPGVSGDVAAAGDTRGVASTGGPQ